MELVAALQFFLQKEEGKKIWAFIKLVKAKAFTSNGFIAEITTGKWKVSKQ